MCLAVTGKIIRIENGFAEIDYGGISKLASLRLFESAKVGDYALVHAGFVIQILDQDDGSELQKLIGETIGFADEDGEYNLDAGYEDDVNEDDVNEDGVNEDGVNEGDVNEDDTGENGEIVDVDKSVNENAETDKGIDVDADRDADQDEN